jgi:hypothetical protein
MYVEIWDFGQHSTLFEFLFLGAHLFIATIDGNLIVANALYVPNIVLSPCIVKLWWNMQIWKLVLFPIDIIYGHVVSFYFFYDNAHRPDLFFEVCWCCQSFFFGSVFLFTVEESMVDTITLSYGLHSQISGVFRSLGSQFFSDGYVSLYWLFFLCM